jgi:hypothetical protein
MAIGRGRSGTDLSGRPSSRTTAGSRFDCVLCHSPRVALAVLTGTSPDSSKSRGVWGPDHRSWCDGPPEPRPTALQVVSGEASADYAGARDGAMRFIAVGQEAGLFGDRRAAAGPSPSALRPYGPESRRRLPCFLPPRTSLMTRALAVTDRDRFPSGVMGRPDEQTSAQC